MAKITISFWVCTILYMYIKFYTQQYPYLPTPWTNLWMPWTVDHQDQLHGAWSIHMDVSGATQQCDAHKPGIGESSWEDFQHGSFHLHVTLYCLMCYETLLPLFHLYHPILLLYPMQISLDYATALTSWYCRIPCASCSFIPLLSHCSTLGHPFHLDVNEFLMNVAFVACSCLRCRLAAEWLAVKSSKFPPAAFTVLATIARWAAALTEKRVAVAVARRRAV